MRDGIRLAVIVGVLVYGTIGWGLGGYGGTAVGLTSSSAFQQWGTDSAQTGRLPHGTPSRTAQLALVQATVTQTQCAATAVAETAGIS